MSLLSYIQNGGKALMKKVSHTLKSWVHEFEIPSRTFSLLLEKDNTFEM